MSVDHLHWLVLAAVEGAAVLEDRSGLLHVLAALVAADGVDLEGDLAVALCE